MRDGARATATASARQLLLAGVVLAGLSQAFGLAGVVVVAERASEDGLPRTLLAAVVAIGIALGTVAQCWGLLRKPGVAATAGAGWRLALDGVMTAAALWFVCWVLVSEPTWLLGAAAVQPSAGVIIASATAAGAVGLACAVGLRAARPRRSELAIGFGASLVAVCGLGLVIGISRADAALTLISSAVLPFGLLVGWLGARRDSLWVPRPALLRRGGAYAFLPMVALALFAIYQLRVDGGISAGGVAAWVVAGFAMVTRQYLTLLDATGYAEVLSASEAHYRELAHTDPLTGLANRRGLLRAVQAGRPGSSYVLLTLDLDGFKQVNDSRGHDVGDAVLLEVGRRLRQNVRPGDVAARLGGDEFAVLMWTGLAEARRVAERLRDVVSRPYLPGAQPLALSASIGLAGHGHGGSLAGLLRNADVALRCAKQRGKNRVELYDPGDDRRTRRRTAPDHERPEAAGRGEPRLAFRPVVALPGPQKVRAQAIRHDQARRLNVPWASTSASANGGVQNVGSVDSGRGMRQA